MATGSSCNATETMKLLLNGLDSLIIDYLSSDSLSLLTKCPSVFKIRINLR